MKLESLITQIKKVDPDLSKWEICTSDWGMMLDYTDKKFVYSVFLTDDKIVTIQIRNIMDSNGYLAAIDLVDNNITIASLPKLIEKLSEFIKEETEVKQEVV